MLLLSGLVPIRILKANCLHWYGGEFVIGEYCYVGEQTHIWSAKSITIGDRVLISHKNTFDNNTHPLSAGARHEQFKEIISGGILNL